MTIEHRKRAALGLGRKQLSGRHLDPNDMHAVDCLRLADGALALRRPASEIVQHAKIEAAAHVLK